MKLCIWLFLACVSRFAAAAPSTRYVVHEKHDRTTASRWIKRDVELNINSIIPVSIALAQQNLENGYEYLMDVSHPDSPNYGKHWSVAKVAETFAATAETIASVKSWLIDHGISEGRIAHSKGRNWLRMNLTVQETENLLHAKYNIFENEDTRKRSLVCDEYSVPLDIKRHIDYITPTVGSGLAITRVRPRRDPLVTGENRLHHTGIIMNGTHLPPPLLPPNQLDSRTTTDILAARQSEDGGAAPFAHALYLCSTYITIACIQALYKMPNGTLRLNSPKASMAVIEFYSEAFIEADIQQYLYNLVTVTNFRQKPTIYVMPDATFQTTNVGENYDAEGNLDLELSMGLLYPQPVWYYQLETDDAFQDAVDASFCSVFPAANSSNCGEVPLAAVISQSWAIIESEAYAPVRQCNEYMKFGLLGTTMLACTGDNGVSFLGEACVKFSVNDPASCPYVTAVGATQIPSGGSVTDQEVAPISYGIYSGGGFSNLWPLPSYQASAISTYYKNYPPPYTSAQYNNSQAQRGIPDISANGGVIWEVLQGAAFPSVGTSASAPIVASLITLINENRVYANKSTVGFINPVLYSNPSAFNDITTGTNPGCGTNGFSAVPGWDPVTGLGTPNYQKLLAIWMALP